MRLPRFCKQRRIDAALVRSAQLKLAAWSVVGIAALAGGCQGPLNLEKGWIDPSELAGRTGEGQAEPLPVQILSSIDPADQTDPRYATASLPMARDLEPITSDYLISPNDQLSITITDLTPGIETVKQQQVTQSGKISLPFLNSIQAAGRTEIELERAIADAYRGAAIVKDAQVSVVVVQPRGRAFSILGAVARPNLYPILQTDFRLLDALVTAGDVTSPLIKTVYVIRRTDEQKPMSGPIDVPADGARPTRTGPGADDLAPGQPNAPATTQSTGAAAPESDLLAPEPAANRVATVDGQQITMRAAPEAPATMPENGTGMMADSSMANSAMATTEPFEFNPPQEPTNVRVIRVPLDKLRAGQLKYNVTIRPGDTIMVQELTVGQYFMGGHVVRPGVYNLTGVDITLKQAIVSAGMLDGVAIPQRTDVVRRIGADKEIFVRVDLAKIFEGQQPDLFLKPDDQVYVGTHFVAPFLAAARGAFRLTYGLGFLYDRNYAYDNQNVRF